MRSLLAWSWLAFCSSLGCTPPKPLPEAVEPAVPAKEVELTASEKTPAPEPTSDKPLVPPPERAPSIEPVLKFTGAFAMPDSVLYDAAADRYLVSNVNGKPGDADFNGYILELLPDGQVKNPRLIAGGQNKVRLDAPRGMAIVGTELWVADITLVRKFDLKTSTHKADIQLPGASLANDIVAVPGGGAYVSDSGVKFTDNGPESIGTEQVFFIDKAGKVKVLAKSKELGGPNGLALGAANTLVVNTLLGDEVYRLTEKGARDVVTKVPGGMLDGLIALDDMLLVSSWKTATIYRGPLGGKLEPLITQVKGAADMGYDSKRNRLLVPRFLDDTVEVYELK